MESNLLMRLTDSLAPLAATFRNENRGDFEFVQIEWSDNRLTGITEKGAGFFRVQIDFGRSPFDLLTNCSICGKERFCTHLSAFVVVLVDSGVAEEIEQNNYSPCTYALNKTKAKVPPAGWKSQLGDLAQRMRYRRPHALPPARFPAAREAIYIMQGNEYSDIANHVVQVSIASRPVHAVGSPMSVSRARVKKSSSTKYRTFNAGVRALAASADALDREIAERISLFVDADSYTQSREQLQFAIPLDTSADLFARIARSGRLFYNSEHYLHDNIVALGWLCDEPFEPKFEIRGRENTHLALGACAVNSQMTISHKDVQTVSSWYFIDGENRIGLFRRPVAGALFESLNANKAILAPREHAAEFIEKVMSIPLGLGVEFVDCEDIRPKRVACVPKARIHFKAPERESSTLEASVRFDYDGVLIEPNRHHNEIYLKQSSTIVQVDSAFHERSLGVLASLGLKVRQNYDEDVFVLNIKKLPAVVAQLIHQGWHVEADGKRYRTGSKFELSVVSGIDWFELQGKAHFDQSSIDLPRLLKSLRAGERSIVLDDGSIGLIPEDWIKQFGGLSELASGDSKSIRFGKSQVGLLDALLVERGEINVDEKFLAAREALRGFDRIEPQEPPGGFVGALRPYQKLAQGWFEFLRGLGFGGCLADDMGLGKTIQVLSLLEHRRELGSGPSLIVVPRSLIFNWVAEATKFTPNLRVLDQSHSQRRRGTEHLTDFDLVLTTYGTLRRDAAFLKDFEFDYVILDEAQAIKNAETEASKAARLLKGRHRLALSGTPIENHLGELWSLFDFLNPGMLGRIGRFSGLAQDADGDERKLLAAAVRPFILRRTKRQVAPELPERIEQTVIVELDADQRRGYDELREYYRQKLLNKIDADGIGKSQIVILEALLRLRQAACHPGLIDPARVAEPSAKIDELLSRLNSAIEAGERVLVFSQFTSLLSIVKLRLNESKIEYLYLDGQTKDRQALVNQFQSGIGPGIFLISLKAGGVGLNLTAARTVYLLDPWWNPAVEAQAIDRTHRIGQLQTVFATRLIAADTVEQKVLELQAKKKGLADAIVNADNAGISSLTREDLEMLLA